MASMKLGLIYVCLAFACCTSVLAQSWRDDRAKLCFVRPENNGAMNVLESWIRVADYNVPVIGGQSVCLFIEPGANELIVTSRYPYDPKSKDDEACKSRKLKLEVGPNMDRTLLICPATKGSSYSCGWRIAALSRGCDDQ